MTRLMKISSILLLTAPLLLGALASNPRGIKNDVAPNTDAPTVTADTQVQPMLDSSEPILANPDDNGLVPEAASSAVNYTIDWYSINGGGAVNATSTNYQAGASVGQAVAGAASSANYQMGIGFWYGAGAGGGCACDCHADPACDGIRSDILDVVATINVAFRGFAASVDPNTACPYETTDINCSDATDVLDVVSTVNVAFRGVNIATEFCDPCL